MSRGAVHDIKTLSECRSIHVVKGSKANNFNSAPMRVPPSEKKLAKDPPCLSWQYRVKAPIRSSGKNVNIRS